MNTPEIPPPPDPDTVDPRVASTIPPSRLPSYAIDSGMRPSLEPDVVRLAEYVAQRTAERIEDGLGRRLEEAIENLRETDRKLEANYELLARAHRRLKAETRALRAEVEENTEAMRKVSDAQKVIWERIAQHDRRLGSVEAK